MRNVDNSFAMVLPKQPWVQEKPKPTASVGICNPFDWENPGSPSSEKHGLNYFVITLGDLPQSKSPSPLFRRKLPNVSISRTFPLLLCSEKKE